MHPEWKSRLSELPFDAAERDAVLDAIVSGWITAGPRTEAFEQAFARLAGTAHAVAVSNGTAALFLTFKGLGIGPGDEVICPSMTFAATAAAIVHCGATPVFADIVSLMDPTIDPEDIERRVTPRTRAVVPVHYAGIPCNMESIGAIAEKHGLKIVEDAAHAPGAAYRGRPVGSLGTAACFSLYGNKNVTTGEGGVITTDDAGLAERLRLARSHGMNSGSWDRERGRPPYYDVLEIGYNFRFDDMRAAIGIAQIKKLEAINKARAVRSRHYAQNLSEMCPALGLPSAHLPPGRKSAYHIFPVVFSSPEQRARVETALSGTGIQTSIHYPPIHTLTAFRGAKRPYTLTRTEGYGSRELTLPLHPRLEIDTIDFIVDRIREAISQPVSA